jgi:hypothetical protein
MNQLELTPEEAEVLSQVLERSLAALELEIQHTDHKDFKNLLKERRTRLRTLIAKASQPMAAAA